MWDVEYPHHLIDTYLTALHLFDGVVPHAGIVAARARVRNLCPGRSVGDESGDFRVGSEELMNRGAP